MSATSLFVTGTDTGSGKTLVTAALLAAFSRRGSRVAGMKPVASGAQATAGGLRSDDALALLEQSNVSIPYALANPYCFQPAIAPHIAAQEAGVRIELTTLQTAHGELALRADLVIAEGAGGWLTPLNERDTLADFARLIGARVILVVGLRLGCINHALLSAQAIGAAGLELAGWIANSVDPHLLRPAENIRTLTMRIDAPLLAVIPHRPGPTAEWAAGFFDPSRLGPLA